MSSDNWKPTPAERAEFDARHAQAYKDLARARAWHLSEANPETSEPVLDWVDIETDEVKP